jgi:hypothetical protein
MTRSDYRVKAIEYFALAAAERDSLMAAQLKSVADAYVRFADGARNPGLTVDFEVASARIHNS